MQILITGAFGFIGTNLSEAIKATHNHHLIAVEMCIRDRAYGYLYQWGRATDGHQKRTSGSSSTLSTNDTPGHKKFILAPNSPYDWRSPQNDNLWQGVAGTNNPCPSGYRCV